METPAPRDRSRSRHTQLFQQSLQRLDEALHSPSHVVRSRSNLNRSTLSKSALERQPLTSSRRSVHREDVDITMDFGNLTTTTTSFRPSMMTSVTVDGSILEGAESTEALSQTLCTDDDPGEKYVSELLDEFLEALLRFPGQHETFDQLDSYRQLTERYADRLGQLLLRVPAQRGQTQLTHTKLIHSQLCKERNTWRLLSALYRDRLLVESVDADAMLVDNVGKPLSDRTIADNLFKCDTTVRQAQIVVDWLEACASDDLVSGFSDKVEFFADTAVAWENSLHALQSGVAGPALVRQLDPDAPVRDRKRLHDLDQEDERRLLRYMFVLVRAGRMDEAQRLCMRIGQPWRAAALEGWKLFHDPNLHQASSTPLPVEGNPLRDLWKCTAWGMSEDARYDLHERAVMAALCGNLAVLLTTCSCWEDRVWAHFKVYVDTRVEAEVRNCTQSLRRLEPLPDGYPEKCSSPAEMFAAVSALEHGWRVATSDVTQLYNTVQQCAILGDEATMLAEMAAFCEKGGGNEQLLRSLAHITLFVRACSGADVSHEHCVTVLKTYVQCLVARQYTPLVARYTALLPPADQTVWYAQLLEAVTERADRLEALRLAEEAGLDTAAATLAVVRNARRRPVDSGGSLTPETTEDDAMCIDVIQWLLFDVSQRFDAVRESNAVGRRLLLAHKLTATHQLMQQLPEDSLAVIVEQWKTRTGEEELPPEQDNTVKEHLCIKAFLLAHDSYLDWSDQLYKQRPHEPQLRDGASFTEKVAHEGKLKQYQSNLERWKTAHASITKTTTEHLYNVLLFPDGGWMADRPTVAPLANAAETTESDRQREMAGLRKLYVPQTVSLLHTVLHESGRLKEATQLADIVAGEDYQLYKEFTKPQLQHFLSKIRETSLQLLDQNLDALAYPFQ